MKIVVCVKQVPATDSVQIDPKTHNLVRSGVAGVINPFDRHAVEAAVALKEQTHGTVIVLTMGPDSYQSTLRESLAMGADEAILLSSRQFAGADTLATGYVISQAIQKIGAVDLVLFGRQAVDADTGQVGPIVAEFLGLPQITFAQSLQLNGQQLKGERLLDNVVQTVSVTLPAVVTARSELNVPRYETPVNIQKSFEKALTVWTEQDLELDPNRIGQAGSPTVVQRVYSPEQTPKQTVMLPENAEQAVDELLQLLRDQNLI